jgi:hypothetical protein
MNIRLRVGILTSVKMVAVVFWSVTPYMVLKMFSNISDEVLSLYSGLNSEYGNEDHRTYR